MISILPRPVVRRVFGNVAMNWLHRASYSLQRLRRACKYFRGRLDDNDARRIMLDCRVPAGWHPLVTLTVEDALEEARSTFTDHPDLRRLIGDACACVEDKWESYNDDLYHARQWALNLVAKYAANEGIKLTKLVDVDDGRETKDEFESVNLAGPEAVR